MRSLLVTLIKIKNMDHVNSFSNQIQQEYIKGLSKMIKLMELENGLMVIQNLKKYLITRI
jgi:hypothetical protein